MPSIKNDLLITMTIAIVSAVCAIPLCILIYMCRDLWELGIIR